MTEEYDLAKQTVVRFIDLKEVLADLRGAVAEAKAAHPEIVRVLLFGSLVRGNWTADSDADLMVVVETDFPDFLTSRTPYQIFAKSIPIDSLVYSTGEFEKLRSDASTFLAQNLLNAIEL